MFVQVIQGHTSDADAVHASVDRWEAELAPGAEGWLGSTGGVADDGGFIAIVRFESEDAARRNSERPEQGAWWEETAALFDGEPTFEESSDIDLDIVGDPDQAGFVQIMRGHSNNPERARELMNDDSIDRAGFRPDILGSVGIGHDGGDYTMVLYFTSEQAAREGEQKEPPAEFKAVMDEMGSLMDGPPEFIDLTTPWLRSPR